MADADQYLDLLTSQHARKPKFRATVAASVQGLVDAQNLLASLPAKFDLDDAVGVQLDAVGLWVGIKREILTPIEGVYFSFGVEGVGFGQGYWRGPYEPTQGLTSLPDEFYRKLLRARIALNHWNGTIDAIADVLEGLFPDNTFYVEDGQNMSIRIAIGGDLDTISAALLSGGYLTLKPGAVRLKTYFSSLPTTPVFGFGANNAYIGGFGKGSWGAPQPYVAPEG